MKQEGVVLFCLSKQGNMHFFFFLCKILIILFCFLLRVFTLDSDSIRRIFFVDLNSFRLNLIFSGKNYYLVGSAPQWSKADCLS